MRNFFVITLVAFAVLTVCDGQTSRPTRVTTRRVATTRSGRPAPPSGPNRQQGGRQPLPMPSTRGPATTTRGQQATRTPTTRPGQSTTRGGTTRTTTRAGGATRTTTRPQVTRTPVTTRGPPIVSRSTVGSNTTPIRQNPNPRPPPPQPPIVRPPQPQPPIVRPQPPITIPDWVPTLPTSTRRTTRPPRVGTVGIPDPRCPLNQDNRNPVLLPHANNCERFYKCDHGLAYEFQCPAGQHWNTARNYCDFPANANCGRASWDNIWNNGNNNNNNNNWMNPPIQVPQNPIQLPQNPIQIPRNPIQIPQFPSQTPQFPEHPILIPIWNS